MTMHHGNEITIQRPTDWGNMGYPQWHRNILVNGELAGYCWGDNEQFAYPNNEYWATLCWGRFEADCVDNRINVGRASRYGPEKWALRTLRDVRRAIGWELESLDALARNSYAWRPIQRVTDDTLESGVNTCIMEAQATNDATEATA